MRSAALVTMAVMLATARPAAAAFINYSSREINVKIVYYGSETAGLAENLQYVYGKTNPEAKGKLISLATETDRTLFFDFLPLSLGEIRGFKTRFHLYTVPGHAPYEASRKLILKGVDGVVFVADADPAQRKATLASWESLKANLAELGYGLEKLPLSVQLDAHRAKVPISSEELRTWLGLAPEVPIFNADPTTGTGVFDTLKSIAKQVLMELKKGPSEPPPSTPPPPPSPARAEAPPPRPCGPYGVADGFGCRVDAARAQAALRGSRLGKASAWLERQLAPTVWVVPTMVPAERLAPGESRFGGDPDLPAALEWPRFQEVPLTFLAELRLADLSALDRGGVLPRTGWLTAFCEAEDQAWEGEPEARDACRLLYFDGPPSALVRRIRPHLPGKAERPPPAASLRFAPGFTLVDPGAAVGRWPFDADGEEYRVLTEAIRGQPPGQRALHHLLGHAQQVQGDPREECRARAAGRHQGGSKTDDWVLVLQLDSDDAPGWSWGDDGMLCFLMTRADLAARRFSEACAVIQGD
jgi:signal recognition particle receptor subunit beta